MNEARTLALLFCIALMSGCAEEPSASLEAAAIYQKCQLCHSKQELQRGPILDGQRGEYLLRQLHKFKNGQRGQNAGHRQEALMGEAINEIDRQDLERVADYIAALAPKPYLPSVKGDAPLGEVIYKNTCASCHGPQAQGIEALQTASLATLEDWYLLTQLRHFKNGRRGIHPDDITGQQMVQTVADMNDRQFIDVVTYISTTFAALEEATP